MYDLHMVHHELNIGKKFFKRSNLYNEMYPPPVKINMVENIINTFFKTFIPYFSKIK